MKEWLDFYACSADVIGMQDSSLAQLTDTAASTLEAGPDWSKRPLLFLHGNERIE
jgi:hypothetical protein